MPRLSYINESFSTARKSILVICVTQSRNRENTLGFYKQSSKSVTGVSWSGSNWFKKEKNHNVKSMSRMNGLLHSPKLGIHKSICKEKDVQLEQVYSLFKVCTLKPQKRTTNYSYYEFVGATTIFQVIWISNIYTSKYW